MPKTGPQKYPGAKTGSAWYQDTHGGNAMESNVVVWHTTEGTSLPTYGGGASAPNFTAVPDFGAKKLVWYQHFDFDVSSRALVNRAGGVETNTLNVTQVELVGTCDPTAHKRWGTRSHLYTPELPSWAIRDLAAFARWARDKHGVPLTSGVAFKSYPASYGATGTRMTHAEWNRFKGHCGHQHVPENDHGDPGNFPIAAILKAAANPTSPKGDTTVSELTKSDVFDAVWKTDSIDAPADSADIETNPTWQAQSILKDTNTLVRAMNRRLAEQGAQIDVLASLVTVMSAKLDAQ